MFGFITKRKNENAIKQLRLKLLSLLKEELPDLYENERHWLTHNILFAKDTITILQTSHEPEYVTNNQKANNKNYRISGVEIFNREKNAYEALALTVASNLITYVHLPGVDFYKKYDVEKLLLKSIAVQRFEPKDTDTALLQELLKEIRPEYKTKIEMADTIEIETPARMYYTILDMEDGNYIAIDKARKVYRLLHDSYQPEKLIDDSLENFLEQYNGDKQTLASYFED